jgi:hypothetical protein
MLQRLESNYPFWDFLEVLCNFNMSMYIVHLYMSRVDLDLVHFSENLFFFGLVQTKTSLEYPPSPPSKSVLALRPVESCVFSDSFKGLYVHWNQILYGLTSSRIARL